MADFLRVTNQINPQQFKTNLNGQNYNSAPVHFMGKQSAQNPQDTVEISTKPKKKKRSLGAKIAIALGSTVGALVIFALAFAKHQSIKLNKLYQEKLVLSNLPEKIDFKPAKTVEEGIKFSKEVLGIKEVSKDFTLESINWANKGLVDVSNAYKGKVFMPRNMHYDSKILEDNTIAGVVRNVELKSFGDLVINSKFFDEKFLNERIKEIYTEFEGKNSEQLLKLKINKEDLRLWEKFKKNPNSISTMEKRRLWQNGRLGNDRFGAYTSNSPMELIRMVNKELVKKGKKSVNLEEISKKSLKEIQYISDDILKEYKKVTGKPFEIYSQQANPFRTIYHEMGHLQDYALNLQKLDIMQYEFNPREVWRQVREAAKRGEKYEDRIGVEELENRWGVRRKFEKLMKKSPEKFKKRYPDAYEFLNNEKIQQTAGEVSLYAQTGIGEFVAEVHAGLIDGKKFSDEVMALYKKYNGPFPGKIA